MPLPGIIIAEQIGLGSDYRLFKSWAYAMVAPGHAILTEDELRQAAETELEAQHFLADLFDQRRRRPENDIILGLVHSHGSDEERLTTAELQSILWHHLGGIPYNDAGAGACHVGAGSVPRAHAPIARRQHARPRHRGRIASL